MNILYAKSFGKDLEAIRYESGIKNRLLELIEQIKKADTLSDIPDVKRIAGYSGYCRIEWVITGLV
jgi:hypothetical protein